VNGHEWQQREGLDPRELVDPVVASRPRNEVMAEAVTSWMRMLAALMLSLMLLSSALLVRAVTRNQPRGVQPSLFAENGRDDHSRHQVVLRGR